MGHYSLTARSLNSSTPYPLHPYNPPEALNRKPPLRVFSPELSRGIGIGIGEDVGLRIVGVGSGLKM